MYCDIHWILAVGFVVFGLIALEWSSNAFVDGSAALARKFGISPFIIGMVIIGFGTCAPEFFVSLFSGIAKHSGLSLGNAYGSCIFNIAGILGVSALISPIAVKPFTAKVASPLLAALSALSLFLAKDGEVSRADAILLLALFALIMPIYCIAEQRRKHPDAGKEEKQADFSRAKIAFDLVAGFAVMVGASHLLVWGSVDIAKSFGVSDLVIGLTIVGIGTSLPELATSIASAGKGESELVLGNIIGSNLFNTLAVVGSACAISPATSFPRMMVARDLPLLIFVSALIGVLGISYKNHRQDGRINRYEGALFLVSFIIYLSLTVYQEVYAK